MKFLLILLMVIPAAYLSAEVELEKITGDVRKEYLEKAQVWRPTDVASMDILRGPQNEISVPPGTEVTCRYMDPEEKLSGVQPKFLCKLENGEIVRVKYGQNRMEIFAEVAASRLFWALGFYADEVYPVRLKCLGCPEKNPFKPEKGERRLDVVMQHVIIERNFPGVAIEAREDEGWDWTEIEKIDPEKGGAPRAHVDALKLLAVFVQHSDSKADNQRLACYKEDIQDPDGDGIGTCFRPVVMIQDLGSTFGSGIGPVHMSKFNYADWRDRSVFNTPKEARHTAETKWPICYGNLTAGYVARENGLNDPLISEEGRKFLAGLLNQLTVQQIRDIFHVAGVEHLNQTIEKDDIHKRATAADWTELFIKKRSEINKRSCPSLLVEK